MDDQYLGPDESKAAAQGKTYFDDTNPKHLQRITKLWWDAVSQCVLSAQVRTVIGSQDFETELRRVFMAKVEAEFVLWQSWPEIWAGFMVWRVLSAGLKDPEWDEVVWPDEWAAGHGIGPLPVPKIKP